jgi:hypothetical protein
MKEFILLLLFGKSLLLTPSPVSIGPSCIAIQSGKTLHVVNGGAALEIRLMPGTNTLSNTVNPVSAPTELRVAFPVGTITATLYRKDGSHVVALNSNVGTGANFYVLELTPSDHSGNADGTIPAYQNGDSFNSVTICSKKLITDAQIYWQTATE